MTEQEWLACVNPGSMMDVLSGKGRFRKLWLFTAASCARVSQFQAPELYQRLSAISELLADAEASTAERQAMRKVTGEWKERFIAEQDFEHTASVRDFELALESPAKSTFAVAGWAIRLASLPLCPGRNDSEYGQYQCLLLRDLFGLSPFRSVSIQPAWLSWHDGLLVSMAQSMYGTRDFSDMPVLADALEEAGCTDAAILNHCRQPGRHVRGCWVMDLLLGKS